MHLALRGYLFIALIALLGIAGTWSEEPAFAGAWLWPAFLLLSGLAAEAWYLRGTQVRLRMEVAERLKLGCATAGAYAFQHNRGREQVLQYARVLPASMRQFPEVRSVRLPPEEETFEQAELVPLRLGAGRFGDVPARLLGRFRLAWWSRQLPQDAPFRVAPDSCRAARARWRVNRLERRRDACPARGWSCCNCASTCPATRCRASTGRRRRAGDR